MTRAIVLVLLCAIVALSNQSLKDRILNNLNKDTSNLRVGVVKVDASLPIGVPLAGYNHGERRYFLVHSLTLIQS
jgi:hypothetical protein